MTGCFQPNLEKNELCQCVVYVSQSSMTFEWVIAICFHALSQLIALTVVMLLNVKLQMLTLTLVSANLI